MTPGIELFVVPIITVLCLLLWHFTPAKAWGWLLAAGALLAFPLPAPLIADSPPTAYVPSQLNVLFVLASATLVTVAVLGAGVCLATSGRRGTGAAIMGGAILLQWIGVVLANYVFLTTIFSTVVTIGMTALLVGGLVGGLVAVLARPGGEMRAKPSWRITIAGSVAVLASLISLFMDLDLTPEDAPTYLQFGVIVLAIALALGVLAGWRAFLGAVVLGMLNSVILILLFPAMDELHDMVAVAVAGLVVGLGLGLIAAYVSSRSTIAITGLASVSLAFFVLMLVLDPESDHFADAWEIATPVLLVVMLIAALAAIATIGDALAEGAGTPAVIVGLATPFQLAGLLFFLGLQSNVEFTGPAINSLLIPSAVGLLIAVGALSLLVNLARRTTRPERQVTSTS